MNKKSQTMFFIAFLVFAVALVLVASALSPLGKNISSGLYDAGYTILSSAKTSTESISNTTLKTELQADIQGAMNKKSQNKELSENYFKYSWIILLLVTAMSVFILVRKTSLQGGLN